VAPDALLINYKSVVMTFTPDPPNAVARVQVDMPLQGVKIPATVPLQGGKPSTKPEMCGDYRSQLKADFTDPGHIRFAGSYPAICGEKVWPVAYIDPRSYNARAVEGLWRNMGGQLSGSGHEGLAPATPASFESVSPTLAEVIRDINKFSNNVMAQQVFLTLGRASQPLEDTPPAPSTRVRARDQLRTWWLQRINPQDAPTLDNGSGLSRQERISARGLGRLLQVAYSSPYMPELMSSLPIVGLDGTLKRSRATLASAHLKTGSLRDVVALAGYVHASSGKQLCLVALVNHTNASAARPALDALLDWVVSDN
jgi:D-alanyl-D-alanine carboxypeptidase/D-alanyl-D-alanine-endopeptidase (penicillin-binding protein 4)